MNDSDTTKLTESACSTWLADTGVTDEDSLRLLCKAVAPTAAGSKRNPLVLPEPGSDDARIIHQILQTRSTPTVAAIETWRTQRPRRERAPVDISRAEIDALGLAMAGQADEHWRLDGCGPTWAELFRALRGAQPLLDLAEKRGGIDRFAMWVLMGALIARGWIVCSHQQRSACAGPSFYASSGKRIRLRDRDQVGELVANSVGKFRSMHDRLPRTEDLVRATRYPTGQPVFRSISDAERQARWLDCAGWVVLQGNCVFERGPLARQRTKERRAARFEEIIAQTNGADSSESGRK